MQAAGVNARYEIDAMRKTITIIVLDEPPKDGGAAANPWDEVLTNAANEPVTRRAMVDRLA
jgi:hypothetical protein